MVALSADKKLYGVGAMPPERPFHSAFGGNRAVKLSIHDGEIAVGRKKVDALNSLPRQ
jgi:hypothetical protein